MRTYTKLNGENPKTTFKRGDIVTYYSFSRFTGNILEINIMVVDHIEISSRPGRGDIYYEQMLTIPYPDPEEINVLEVRPNYRNWFNHDNLSDATPEQIKIFIQALATTLVNEGVNTVPVKLYDCDFSTLCHQSEKK